ncbi:MAG: sigma-70 family RNA polymerase sigma factor [Planctomycetota bacterium]|nr:MAG: sigma-70 family RNA polymerase sigma factor [Planctomycetota bacterium]
MAAQPEHGTPELVERAASGDDVAIEELLQRYLPRVRAYLRVRAGRLLLDKESASDLAQSVCRAVLEHADLFHYGHEDGFRRWLFKTAERKVVDRYAYYTAQKRTPEAGRTVPDVDIDATLSVYAGLHTPSRDAVAREELARLERAIERLPEEMQEVVILAKIAGLSRDGIAAELGKSEGAVRMTLHRALARLADSMAGADPDA